MTRRRASSGFIFIDNDGDRITEDNLVDRIKTLAIPPAWEDV